MVSFRVFTLQLSRRPSHFLKNPANRSYIAPLKMQRNFFSSARVMSSDILGQNPTPSERHHGNILHASYYRGGTSKGIFIARSELPADKSLWNDIFLGLMGSPDPVYGRQLNGMGGGISSLSKICVVEPSDRPNVDVDYTFYQIGIRDSTVDTSGNCGNLSSMIGVFAVDAGLCLPLLVSTHSSDASVLKRASVRSFNTNTGKLIATTFPVDEKSPGTLVPNLDVPETSIAGVHGLSSTIAVEFLNPAGAKTGKLLPSGQPIVQIPATPEHPSVSASLVDATNPTVFIQSSDVQAHPAFSSCFTAAADSTGVEFAPREFSPEAYTFLEHIRAWGSNAMGIIPLAQAQPKIAILSPPSQAENDVNIVVHALSMGVLHKAVPMTVGLCLGVAANVKGTIAWDIAQKTKLADSAIVRIRHPGGVVDVGANIEPGVDGAEDVVHSASVIRTGRRLMKGIVWY